MSITESSRRIFSSLSENYGTSVEITDYALSFESRRAIADVLYPTKIPSKRQPKPKTPKEGPLPEIINRTPRFQE